jgi:hypothetical protein
MFSADRKVRRRDKLKSFIRRSPNTSTPTVLKNEEEILSPSEPSETINGSEDTPNATSVINTTLTEQHSTRAHDHQQRQQQQSRRPSSDPLQNNSISAEVVPNARPDPQIVIIQATSPQISAPPAASPEATSLEAASTQPTSSEAVKTPALSLKPASLQVLYPLSGLWDEAIQRLSSSSDEGGKYWKYAIEIVNKDRLDKAFPEYFAQRLDKVRTSSLTARFSFLKPICQHLLALKSTIRDAVPENSATGTAFSIVFVLLALTMEISKRREEIVQGLLDVADLSCQLIMLETRPAQDYEDPVGSAHYREQLINLAVKILEFQSRAVYYLERESVRKTMAKAAGITSEAFSWSSILSDLKKSAEQVQNTRTILDSGVLRMQLQIIHEAIESSNTWEKYDSHCKLVAKFFTALDNGYDDAKEIIAPRVDDTCQWFFSSAEYQEWDSEPTNNLLWLKANPGLGKSVLAKSLSDKELMTTDERTTCSFFFRADRTQATTSVNALCSLLWQTFDQRPELLTNDIIDSWTRKKETFCSSFDLLWKVFQSIIQASRSGKFVFILDALDECREHQPDLSQLIESIRSLNKGVFGTTNYKFLFTSQPLERIGDLFQNSDEYTPVICFEPEQEERSMERISEDVNRVIEYGITKKFKHLDSERREHFVSCLRAVENRTCLWVSLALESIEPRMLKSKHLIEKAIKGLDSVDKAYSKILDRSENKEDARPVLHLILAAGDFLPQNDMNLALAVYNCIQAGKEVNEANVKHYLISDFQLYVENVCGPFLIMKQDLFFFHHQTAKEFLVSKHEKDSLSQGSTSLAWKHSFHPQESSQVFAEALMGYYGSSLIKNPIYHEPHSIKTHHHLKHSSFFEIAFHEWSERLKISSPEFQRSKITQALKLCERVVIEIADGEEDRTTEYKAPFMEACRRGLYMVVERIIQEMKLKLAVADGEESPLDKPENGKTGLILAVSGGYEHLVKLLLDSKLLDVHAPGSGGRTALYWAILGANQNIITLLLKDEKLDIDAPVDVHGRNAIGYACTLGNVATVRSILYGGKRRPNVEHQDRSRKSALMIAEGLEDKTILHMLKESTEPVKSVVLKMLT